MISEYHHDATNSIISFVYLPGLDEVLKAKNYHRRGVTYYLQNINESKKIASWKNKIQFKVI